jgi:hypothetical protein
MIVGVIEELNLFQICVSSWLAFNIYVIALSMHGSLFVLHVTCFCFCRFEARASHHNHTVCQFFLCWCWPVTSNNLRIIAWDWVMISLIDLWPIRYFNATLAASMQCRTLILPFIKKLGFTQQCLISNFPWLVVILSIFFRNPFYIIYLDKKHPIALACIANRVTDLYFPLSLNVFVYAHVNVGVFTRTPFLPYPVWCHLSLQRMDGATDVDAWLYFPGLKVRIENWSLFFFFDNFCLFWWR